MVAFSSRKTPSITIMDNRALTIRQIEYCRHPDTPELTDERITYQRVDSRSFLVGMTDSRLHGKGRLNFYFVPDLAGLALLTTGVDSGSSLIIKDIEGRLLLRMDANDVQHTYKYEGTQSLGRLIRVLEKKPDSKTRTAEYFEYAEITANFQNANLCGQCIRHYDTAGLLQLNQVSILGHTLSQTRRLIQYADDIEFEIDWQNSERDEQLVLTPHISQLITDALGANILSIDAKGHQQRFIYDIAGQLTSLKLTIKGELEHPTIKSIEYSATGQKLREEQGNGVVIYYEYEPQTQRLIRFRVERPTHRLVGFKCFQDLRYQYDPVGNILCIRNDAEETRFWRNQKIEPEQQFTYDTLYQLVSATGREQANIYQQNNLLPPCFRFDNSTYTYYRRTYTHDNSGNLIHIHHQTPALHSGYSTKLTVSEWSNRAVEHSLTTNPNDVDTFFTPSGQQKQLLQGQELSWTARQELQGVTTESLNEFYRYDSDSQRVIKSSQQHHQETIVVYLPNLELKTVNNQEKLQVIKINTGKGNHVQVLHWEQGKPEGMDNNTIRYCINTLSDSSSLEIGGQGQLISQEEYYPYGGTSVWLAQSAIEAEYKTYRYSGKERDVTGLYYYGRRYYQPWIGRWLSADPGGTIDGLNLFRMTKNNPLKYQDNDGLNPIDRIVGYYHQYTDYKAKLRANQSYKTMSLGQKWLDSTHTKPVFDNLDEFFIKTQQNMTQLETRVGSLSDDESNFVDKFVKLDFTLLHFSEQSLLESPNSATFRSRDDLLEKRILSACEMNTTSGDIQELGTTDFAFFSLGVKGASGKTRSEFGGNRYTTSIDDIKGYKYMNYSHMAINDTLDFYRRETDVKRLNVRFPNDYPGVTALKKETIANSAIETLYSYHDFRSALALRIVDSSRLLSFESQQSVYETSGDESFDQLISLFYRPQMLVPKKLESKATNMFNARIR